MHLMLRLEMDLKAPSDLVRLIDELDRQIKALLDAQEAMRNANIALRYGRDDALRNLDPYPGAKGKSSSRLGWFPGICFSK